VDGWIGGWADGWMVDWRMNVTHAINALAFIRDLIGIVRGYKVESAEMRSVFYIFVRLSVNSSNMKGRKRSRF
jgi:hypothetical protein